MGFLSEANNIIQTVKQNQREIAKMKQELRLACNRALDTESNEDCRAFSEIYHRWQEKFASLPLLFSEFPEVIMFDRQIEDVNKMLADWQRYLLPEFWARLTAAV